MNEPNESTPALIRCPSCDGRGCDYCDDLGEIAITECPKRIAANVSRIIGYADLYKKGLPPVAGGALDQCLCFIDACNFIWAEESANGLNNPFGG